MKRRALWSKLCWKKLIYLFWWSICVQWFSSPAHPTPAEVERGFRPHFARKVSRHNFVTILSQCRHNTSFQFCVSCTEQELQLSVCPQVRDDRDRDGLVQSTWRRKDGRLRWQTFARGASQNCQVGADSILHVCPLVLVPVFVRLFVWAGVPARIEHLSLWVCVFACGRKLLGRF